MELEEQPVLINERRNLCMVFWAEELIEVTKKSFR